MSGLFLGGTMETHDAIAALVAGLSEGTAKFAVDQILQSLRDLGRPDLAVLAQHAKEEGISEPLSRGLEEVAAEHKEFAALLRTFADGRMQVGGEGNAVLNMKVRAVSFFGGQQIDARQDAGGGPGPKAT